MLNNIDKEVQEDVSSNILQALATWSDIPNDKKTNNKLLTIQCTQ